MTGPGDRDRTDAPTTAPSAHLSLVAVSELCWHADAACRALERGSDAFDEAFADAAAHLASVIELVLALGAEALADAARSEASAAP